MHPDASSLAAVEQACRLHFETEPERAAVSFVGVEQIEVLRFAEGALRHYVTLGMARYPLADPTDSVVDVAGAPRGELMLSTLGEGGDVWRSLALLAAAPAVEGAVYRVGSRLDLGEPLVRGSRCTGGVLSTPVLRPVEVSGMAPIEIFLLCPATATELAWARVHGSDALMRRWDAHRVDLRDLARDPVSLD